MQERFVKDINERKIHRKTNARYCVLKIRFNGICLNETTEVDHYHLVH